MKGKELPLTVLFLVLGGLLVYIRSQLGDAAFQAFILFFSGVFTGIVCTILGSKINDQGQHTFFEGLAQLKSIVAPVVREQARTNGAHEREQIKLDYRQAAAAQPSPEEQAVEDWYKQYEHYR